jgi:hypothetical protein
VPNLSDEIGELIDSIDGQVIDIFLNPSGSYSVKNNGKAIAQESWGYYITTTAGTYYLGITWEIANNFAPEETGIRSIGVTDQQDFSLLALISAPDGIRHGM